MRAGAADPSSFHDGGAVSGSRHVPGQVLAALSTAQDEDVDVFRSPGAHRQEPSDAAPVVLVSPKEVAKPIAALVGIIDALDLNFARPHVNDSTVRCHRVLPANSGIAVARDCASAAAGPGLLPTKRPTHPVR